MKTRENEQKCLRMREGVRAGEPTCVCVCVCVSPPAVPHSSSRCIKMEWRALNGIYTERQGENSTGMTLWFVNSGSESPWWSAARGGILCAIMLPLVINKKKIS